DKRRSAPKRGALRLRRQDRLRPPQANPHRSQANTQRQEIRADQHRPGGRQLTLELMRNTFELLPPLDIVNTYIKVGKGGKADADGLWSKFGTKTIQAMRVAPTLSPFFGKARGKPATVMATLSARRRSRERKPWTS